MRILIRSAALCAALLAPALAAATENCVMGPGATPVSSTGATGGTGDHSHLGSTRYADGISGLDAAFRDQVAQMISAANSEFGGSMEIYSGYRSVEHQQELWEAALIKYGDPEIADNWVAPPGNSMHNEGLAVDLRFNGQRIEYDSEISAWMDANMSRFGLHRPLSNEGWHVEPVGARSGSGFYASVSTGAATSGSEACEIMDLPTIALMPWDSETVTGAVPAGAY